MPVVSVSSASVIEGGSLNFTVSLSEAAIDAVTLDYQALPGTAEDTDIYYNLSSNQNANTLTFAPGETSKTIEIATRSDSGDERDESLVLRLSALSANASFAGGETALSAQGVILDNDGAGTNLALLVSDVELVEGDAGSKLAVFELRLSRPAEQGFTVSYRTRDISATAGSDYTETIGQATFAVGDEVKTVRVPVRGDTAAEVTESFALVVTAPAAPSLDLTGLAGVAVIRDDDTAPQPVVSVAPAAATEGKELLYTITLSEPTFDAVSMSYRMLAGTGADGDLYYGLTSNQNTGTVTFAPGETSKTVGVYLRQDAEDERDESLVLELSGLSTNASFAGGERALQATGVGLDDDGSGSNLALLVSDVTMIEGDKGSKAALFELRLTRPAEQAFTVSYRTRDISATAGSDYAQTIGSVSFAPGEEVKVVRVPVYGDVSAETTESFALVVDPPAGLSLGTAGLAGEAVIRDDDSGAGPVVSIAPAAATEGRELIYTVTLSEPSADEVSMGYETVTGSGAAADVYYDLTSNQNRNTLTFAAGETQKIVRVYLRQDALDERDESLGLQLFNLSANARFAGGEDRLAAIGVVHDDDGLGGNLALLASRVTLVEGDSGTKEAVFELRLSQPASQAITVTYATRDITAKAGEDYAARSGSVSFAVGEQVKTVRVPVMGDTALEDTERFGLRLAAPGTAGLAIEQAEPEALILDDDGGRDPVISVLSATALEGEALLYTVMLSEDSQDAVSVDYKLREGTASEADIYYGLSSGQNTGTLTFAAGETTRTLVVYTRSDGEDERDETIFLELSNAVNARLADGAPSVRAVGTILDDDGAGLNRIATVAPVSLREQAVASFVYEIPVALSAAASAPLSFTVTAIDQTALAGRDYRLLDSRVGFAAGQSVAAVSVAVLGDSQAETTEAFTLSLDPVAGTPYTGGVADQVIYIRPGPLLPGAGNDVFKGTVGNDSINLLAGNDVYEGLEGNDTALGGAGDDTLIGGAGSDALNGQGGNDLLISGDVEDVSSEAGAQVFRLYQATLGRVPDTAGFDNWSARLDSGAVPLGDVIRGFVKSAEFQSTYGALGNKGFVSLLYNNVLDRAPDAAGLANWSARLDSGTSREQVVQGFAQSAEFMLKTNPQAFAYVDAAGAAPWADDVFRLYQATLDRAPDLPGLLSWAERLGDGSDFLSVVGGFVNSQEFQNTYGAVGNRGFVTLLYNNVLDRAPDAAGLNNWSARLNAGMSREKVVEGFAQSAEFVQKTAPAFEAYMAAAKGDRLDGGPGNDLLYGDLRADTFVFGAADKGADRVLELDAWDSVEFNGFGYARAGQALAHMHEAGEDVVFSDQGVSVIFMRADLALMHEVTLLV